MSPLSLLADGFLVFPYFFMTLLVLNRIFLNLGLSHDLLMLGLGFWVLKKNAAESEWPFYRFGGKHQSLG